MLRNRLQVGTRLTKNLDACDLTFESRRYTLLKIKLHAHCVLALARQKKYKIVVASALGAVVEFKSMQP